MFPSMQKYMEMKYGPKKPEAVVTTEEFIAASVAAGVPEEKAKFNATICKGLGSSTEVGGRMLTIKD